MVSAWGMMVDAIASDGWDKYHMMSEHKHIVNPCLNNFIKIVDFL